MKSFKKFTLLVILLFIYIIASAISYTNAVCTDISSSVFRLHVVANSDSEDDQNLKYIVRDNVLAYMNSLTNDATNKFEIMSIVSKHLEDFKQIAQNTVYKNGYNYQISIEIGNFEFPTKTYGDVSFPPGFYDALRINIGEAKGQNWWCVMFPPLCFIDVSSGVVPNDSKEILKSELTEEDYLLVTENTKETKIKFKIVELLQNFKISGIFM